MAPSPIFRALAAITCLMLAHTIQAATLPPATYNPANIVADIKKDCPVKNVLFDKKVFNAESLLNMPDVLKHGGVSQKCQDAAVTDLVNCFSDDSLQIMTGCCSTTCATAVKKNIQAGCFAEYQTAICSDPKTASVKTGLFYAAKRCGNYAAACSGTTANSTTNLVAAQSNTTTPATAANSTAANSTEDSSTQPVVPAALATTGNRSTSSQTTTTAPAAPATSSTAKNAAGSSTVSMALSLAAVVMAIVVATGW